MTDFGLNRLALNLFYRVGIECDGSYSNLPSTSEINTAAANFPAGIALDLYVADELNGCTKAYPALKTIGINAHAANRSVKTIMTANTTDSNLYGAIDHWVLLDSVQQWPALPFTGGGDLWSYTSCNAGFGNAPEWMVDYPPINERIQAGFLNWTQGATGILYYRADGWSAGNTIGSWNNVDTTNCEGGHKRPGDGIFSLSTRSIASTESAPGIRLKAIRDGIQGLRIRPDSQEPRASCLCELSHPADCDELEQLESRPERAGKCTAAIGATAQPTFASIGNK